MDVICKGTFMRAFEMYFKDKIKNLKLIDGKLNFKIGMIYKKIRMK